MKKIFISLTWLLCSMAAMAQGTGASDAFFSTERSDEDVSFSIRVGVNASTLVLGMEDGTRGINQRRMGFTAGVSMDVPILESLGFQTGVYFVQKGMKEEAENVKTTQINGVNVISSTTKTTGKGNPGYMEVPLLASYRHQFKRKVLLQVSTGPFLAYGVCGKERIKTKDNLGLLLDYNVDWFGGEDSMNSLRFRRFDMGWHLGAGLTFKGGISLGYAFEAGFLDTGRMEDYSLKTRCHTAYLGFAF